MRKSSTFTGEIASSLKKLSGPFSVYIHIPFCLRKCPYCSFFSVPLTSGESEKYLGLLKEEICFYTNFFPEEAEASTVYFGGGTPTMLTPGQWDELLSFLRSNFRISPSAEITVEANPESFSEHHAAIWKKWGVSRVSIGVQSFSDEDLLWLCRPHDAAGARRAVQIAVREGFSVSADLMFGLRCQNLRSWALSVKLALDLGVDHISVYQLSIDEGCPWSASPPAGLSDGYPFYRWSQWYLPRKGFTQYEIASFSLSGHHSRHNTAYWLRSPVLGLGAGAWGFLGGNRYRNEGSLEKYADSVRAHGGSVAGMERCTGEKAAREAAVLLLRTKWGIAYDEFSQRYGSENLNRILDILKKEAPADCFFQNPCSLSLTPKGMRVANALWSLIV